MLPDCSDTEVGHLSYFGSKNEGVKVGSLISLGQAPGARRESVPLFSAQTWSSAVVDDLH